METLRSLWQISPFGWSLAAVGTVAALIYHALPLVGVRLTPTLDAFGDVTHIVILLSNALVIFNVLRHAPRES